VAARPDQVRNGARAHDTYLLRSHDQRRAVFESKVGASNRERVGRDRLDPLDEVGRRATDKAIQQPHRDPRIVCKM
jgi:hypothetical protein